MLSLFLGRSHKGIAPGAGFDRRVFFLYLLGSRGSKKWSKTGNFLAKIPKKGQKKGLGGGGKDPREGFFRVF